MQGCRDWWRKVERGSGGWPDRRIGEGRVIGDGSGECVGGEKETGNMGLDYVECGIKTEPGCILGERDLVSGTVEKPMDRVKLK